MKRLRMSNGDAEDATDCPECGERGTSTPTGERVCPECSTRWSV